MGLKLIDGPPPVVRYSDSMTLHEMRLALTDIWRDANDTDAEGRFTRPDYRQAVDDIWKTLVMAVENRDKTSSQVDLIINVAMSRFQGYK